MAAVETFHLWRQYPTAPFYRWACEVVADAEAPEGYRVIAHDPIVADTTFFHRLSASMARPVDVLAMKQDKGIVAHEAQRKEPGSDDYFAHAIRAVEGAILGQSPDRYKKLNAPRSAP